MPNDDIVTRLREAAVELGVYGVSRRTTLDAADEIERLRADRDRWRRAARLYRLAVMHYDEAVRGE